MFNTHHLRLSELQQQVFTALKERFDSPIWIIAEIAKLNSNPTGHTYFELVEKQGDKIIAQTRATLWKSQRSILVEFEKKARQPLRQGMEALLLASVEYHSVYGFSLNILEIDANYTLGDLARRRQEVIDRLTNEGLLQRNKHRILPPVLQRIAVISSATAAGYDDFINRLENNAYGYSFYPTLFSSVVQGDGAESSLLAALSTIQANARMFDCAVLIRGGGGSVDLSCFDGYPLARSIAECSIPVITGIGHDRDESVADMTSFHNAATPTAAAEFIILRAREYEDTVYSLSRKIGDLARTSLRDAELEMDRVLVRFIMSAKKRLGDEENTLETDGRRLSAAVRAEAETHTRTITQLAVKLDIYPRGIIKEQTGLLAGMERSLANGSKRIIQQTDRDLLDMERNVRSRHPLDALRRGYSITRCGGKAIRNVEDIRPGAEIETMAYTGVIKSIVHALEASRAVSMTELEQKGS